MPLGASFKMYLVEFIYLYLLACQVELQQAIQVFVVVSLVCRAPLFPFLCRFIIIIVIQKIWANED